MDIKFFSDIKSASAEVAMLEAAEIDKILNALADAIDSEIQELLAANASDLSRMSPSSPLYDRLQLTEPRLHGIAEDMRHVAGLPSPLGRILIDKTMPNGLHLRKVSVPFGVIGVVYEARPNVTFDVFSLCFKSGSACILKGGKDADDSNRAAVSLIRKVLSAHGVTENAVALMPTSHEAVGDLLNAVGFVDLVIPRGGRKLIDFVRDNAHVPIIETGAGVVDTYFDLYGDIEKGKAIVNNAKTRRVSVCNALDCLLVHAGRIADLPALVAPLAASNVELYADERAFQALSQACPAASSPASAPAASFQAAASPSSSSAQAYPAELLHRATPDSFGTEYMDYKMSVRTVDSLDEALAHIARYGSGHSECIVTENSDNARIFQKRVDAACVYVNAPTSFTDGGQFGLGAEIGISTQKLGARGPMGLEEIATYKWLIDGNGQIRK